MSQGRNVAQGEMSFREKCRNKIFIKQKDFFARFSRIEIFHNYNISEDVLSFSLRKILRILYKVSQFYFRMLTNNNITKIFLALCRCKLERF